MVIDFDFTISCAPRSLASVEHEVGDFGRRPCSRPPCRHAPSTLRSNCFQVVIEILDGVLLDRVGLGAQLLVIGQDVSAAIASLRLSISRPVAV